jgi:mannose-1-phosphate guanylyltransferase
MAIERAGRLVAPARTVAVVAAAHRQWWEPELAGSALTVLEQPANRGTAAGILLPLWHVRARDPRALVAFFPSDHHVSREWVLATAVAHAAAIAERDPHRVVLLGVRPEWPDPSYGWVVPGQIVNGVRAVRTFVEKPAAGFAEELMRSGAQVNMFVFVGAAGALLELFSEALPELLEAFRGAPDLESLYASIPAHDFSRDVLERVPERLVLLPVPPCGWTDLGTPERVAACLRRDATVEAAAGTPSPAPLPLPPLLLEHALGSFGPHSSTGSAALGAT